MKGSVGCNTMASYAGESAPSRLMPRVSIAFKKSGWITGSVGAKMRPCQVMTQNADYFRILS